MKRNIAESENFIDKWWSERTKMFVDIDGCLYMVFNDKDIYYPMEEKIF